MAGKEVELVDQGTGYGLIIGLGALFAILILISVRVQRRYLLEDSDHAEMFMVANRSIGTGLTASAVFSSWMWINESMYSTVFAYRWGVAAPVWFASGLSFQIALMAVLGIAAKLRVPCAHTSMEFVRIRYGQLGHVVFIFLNLINNSAMVITASQLVTGISGMNLAAATVLIPAGVVVYTAVGGIKATFITDFLHTAVALSIMIYFTLKVLTNEHVGGLGGLYDKLRRSENLINVDGNYRGSLLTFKSYKSAIFGVVLKVCNLALVIMDTAFWQKSFASHVRSTVPGYDLASIAIIAVPWGIGTVIGLSARAIENTPVFVTYPHAMTDDQINSGLVMPFVLKSLFGSSACAGVLVLIFMDITSTVSSSLIAVSSILSFDIYKTYINTSATDRQIMTASHIGVVAYGLVIVGWTLAMNYAGANGNWILYFLPVTTSPGIFPVLFTLLWSRQTKLAAIVSPLIGLCAGIGVWLGLSYSMFGAVTIATTSEQMPALYASLTSLFTPAVLSVAISLVRPASFDWQKFLQIGLVRDSGSESSRFVEPSDSGTSEGEKAYGRDGISGLGNASGAGSDEKQPFSAIDHVATQHETDQLVHPLDDGTLRHIRKWLKIAIGFLLVNISVTILIWPLSMYRDYIFDKTFFKSWVSVSILWQFFALLAVVIYPLFDGRHAIGMGLTGFWSDLRNVGSGKESVGQRVDSSGEGAKKAKA
ncbi:SSS family solute:Na+ symporter [Teratosphaeria nubilosa]|uniref:SSS family solute:Na+ symporter n=1 Tax=Teratosphaeria nubilosa TaxID=161662 RepID=A0A6G1L828_9PEZI|nr:SSS family solute:Na+ symporter [Teratosphaeria nubilosa]